MFIKDRRFDKQIKCERNRKNNSLDNDGAERYVQNNQLSRQTKKIKNILNAWEAKENKSVLKNDISTRDVINSINWLLFDVFQKSHFALHDHCSPFNARSIIRKKNTQKHCRIDDDQWSQFSASFKCKLAFCSNALISNHNDWQCHVVVLVFFCFLFSFWFRYSVYRNQWYSSLFLFFFWRRSAYFLKCWLKCVCMRRACAQASERWELKIENITEYHAHMLS